MEYAPWPIGRPYDGGFRYNCMVLKVRTSSQYPKAKPCEIQLTLEDSGDEKATSLGYSIGDETCEVTWNLFQCSLLKFYCPILTFQDANVLSTVRDRCSSEKSHH